MAWPPNTHQDVQDAVTARAVIADIGTAGTPTGDALNVALGSRFSARSAPGLAGTPTLMPSPPTVGPAIAGAPASSITNAVAVNAIDGSNNPNTAAFSFKGGPWAQYGTVFPNYLFAAPKPLSGGEPPNFPYVEFLYYGQAFEFGYKGQGTLITRVWVNGQLAENTYTGDSTQDGATHLRKVTFAAPGMYRVRIDIITTFSGLNIGPNDVVIPAPTSGGKLLVVHDSYGEGTGATDPFTSYAPLVAAMLGMELIDLSQGGTGVLADNSSLGRVHYRQRASDWTNVGATAVLVGMSINDEGFTTAQINTELQQLLPAIKALPGSPTVWVMGPPPRGGGDVAAKQAFDAAVSPTVQALNVPYIPLVTPTAPWTGTGRQGATTGSGSSDVLMASDNAHPTQAGHQVIARTFVTRLLSTLTG